MSLFQLCNQLKAHKACRIAIPAQKTIITFWKLPAYAGQGSNVYAAQISDDGQQLSKFRGPSEKWSRAAEYCAFFPNVLYGVHKDHTFAIVLLSKGQKTITERIAFYYADA